MKRAAQNSLPSLRTLATVQSIVWQGLRTATDPKVFREAVESRLGALSRSHDLLTNENWKSVGLVDLLNAALEPFVVADGRAKRIVIRGENIRFPPQAALALSIAFNELATNAVKYGAFSNATGSIVIEWKIEPALEGRRLILRWKEKERARQVGADKSSGAQARGEREETTTRSNASTAEI